MHLVGRSLPTPSRWLAPPPKAGRIAIALSAAWSGQDVAALMDGGRGPAPLTRARHLASYLGHVALGVPHRELAVLLGRDRTSLAYACARIEDGREDVAFDCAVQRLEAAAAFLLER